MIRKRDRSQDPINLKAVAALAGLFAAPSGEISEHASPYDDQAFAISPPQNMFSPEDRRHLKKMNTFLGSDATGNLEINSIACTFFSYAFYAFHPDDRFESIVNFVLLLFVGRRRDKIVVFLDNDSRKSSMISGD